MTLSVRRFYKERISFSSWFELLQKAGGFNKISRINRSWFYQLTQLTQQSVLRNRMYALYFFFFLVSMCYCDKLKPVYFLIIIRRFVWRGLLCKSQQIQLKLTRLKEVSVSQLYETWKKWVRVSRTPMQLGMDAFWREVRVTWSLCYFHGLLNGIFRFSRPFYLSPLFIYYKSSSGSFGIVSHYFATLD